MMQPRWKLVRQFSAGHWWHAPSQLAAGSLEAALGHAGPAFAAWREAARLDVHDAEAPSAAAALCLQEQHLAQARDFEHEAMRRQPDSPKQHALLAQILERTGDAAGAAEQAQIARRLISQADAP